MKAPRGAAQYRLLSAALEHVNPPCADDPRFVMDATEYDAQELDHLRFRVCRTCPLEPLCDDYGQAARPPAGVWAGRVYKPRTSSPTADN